MIRKLRKKFILINMLLVSAVLLIVFSSIFAASSRRLEKETGLALLRALDQQKERPFPKPSFGPRPDRTPFDTTPVFCVTLDPRERIISVLQNNGTVTEEILSEAVREALAAGKSNGVLRGLNLRFQIQQEKDGQKIAFADRTNEIHSLRSLFFSSLVTGAGGLLAFFLISLFLSNWALRPVEASWSQQRQFVADASHELKTPLTVILANTGILLSHPQESIGSQLKWVENTHEEAVRMKKLVDDLVFLAKSDQARIPLVLSSFSISDAVMNCLLSFEPVAFEAGLTIQSEITPELTLSGDEPKIKQLIMILLDNACKYAGAKGTVTVSLSAVQDRVCLKTHNTGEPIPPGDLPHIFERFYRADKSRAHGEGSCGLGLAIAYSIVKAHHGRISVRSSQKQGTAFTVLL